MPAIVAAGLAAGCGPRLAGQASSGARARAAVDSVFAAGGFGRPLSMRGRATFDVEQYRVHGRFELRVAQNNDAVLEFGGTTLLGGHREDVLVSLTGDTLRVLDRERGRFYEGDGVRRMVEASTGTDGDWARALGRVLMGAGAVAGVEETRRGEGGLDGRASDGAFRLRTDRGRLVEAVWPDPGPGQTFRDRLEVRYRWDASAPVLIEARLPVRGWRVRLEAD